MGMIAGFDHVLLAVTDLAAAEQQFQRLGFTLCPRGRHIGWGTGNACAMLADGYIELLGSINPIEFDNGLGAFLANHGEGLMGVSLDPGPTGLEGVAPFWPGSGPTKPLSRLLDLPGGTVQPHFRLLPLPAEALGPVPAFFCEHLTPDLLRQPSWLNHPNGALGLDSITWLVEDVLPLAQYFQRLLGPDAVFTGIGRVDIQLGRHRLHLLDPMRAGRRYRNVPLPAAPKGLVLTLRVADLDQAAQCALQAGITPVPAAGRRVVLPPQQACGVIVEYCLD